MYVGELRNETKQIKVCPCCGAKIHSGGSIVTTLQHIPMVATTQKLKLNVKDFDVVTKNAITLSLNI